MKAFFKEKKRSAGYARDRMKLLLISERIDCSPQMMKMLRNDTIENPILYVSARKGTATLELDTPGTDLRPHLKMGRHGKFTKELWITRRENSKSLTWSSAVLAFRNIEEIGAEVERPKALGDIRGVPYIYALFCRFGLIKNPRSL